MRRILCTFLFTLFLPLLAIGAPVKRIARDVNSPYNGKVIRSIKVERRELFDEPNLPWFYKKANDLKIDTKESVLRRELLIKEGDLYDEFKVRESERQLREQRFLRNVKIKSIPDGDVVDLIVSVQETWTLVPQASFSNGGGTSSRSIGISDSNFLGYGKRLGLLLRENDNRKDTEFLWDDPRVLGSQNQLVTFYADREDGNKFTAFFGRPFRTLVDEYAWKIETESADLVGRLFNYGDETYIYRVKTEEFKPRFSYALSSQKNVAERTSFGFTVERNKFTQADLKDYEALDLDPNEVSNDPLLLPKKRIFQGPTWGYQYIFADFITMNYIDRFDRSEDYNLGPEYTADVLLATETFGSEGNSYHFSGNHSRGWRFSNDSFARMEIGSSTRVQDDQLQNSLVRAEFKYFKVLGSLYAGDQFIGKHTLASTFFVDYGNKLDKDRQFLIGSDNAIRGYKARAFEGDKRLALILEDRVHIADDILKLFSVGAVAFIDAGGSSRDSVASIVTDDLYSDVGLGLRLAFPRSSGGGVLRFDVALPLREGADGTKQYEPRFTVSAGQVFGARLRSETLGSDKANVDIGFDR